ncbi:hypothetical protein GCM10011578_038270 [Streptomyces fuscichromogenes]|uniref:Recombinase domain-containing protein n=1 Tax=Streptomyces fuscichromogenes TaxID=1324013 RepID=A0A917XE25_9ACTN|nr:hypothetical protein GCM10011578_038270 [Streptomyces fuscichromogenes]
MEIGEGRVDLVLVHRLDRLGRTESAVWRRIWQIEDAGLERWLTIDRLAQAVEADYRRIVARTQAGRQLKALDGGWPGGPAPYGYRISGKGAFGSTLEVDPAEAAVVLLLVDLVIEGGRTLMDIAEELNGRAIPTRSGKRWTRVNLHRRLQSAAFVGEAVFRRPDQQWGGHCTRLGNDGRPLHGESVLIPLTGRIHGSCGRPYVGCFRSEDGVRTYRCSGWNAASRCGCPFLRADHAEEQVARQVNVLPASMPRHSRPMPPASSQAQTQLIRHPVRVRSLELLIAQCAEEIDGSGRQEQHSRAIAAAMRQLEAEQEAFERILAHARDWLAELEDRVDWAARLTSVLGAAAPDIRSLSSSEQRGLLESLKVRVDIVDPDFRHREGRDLPERFGNPEKVRCRQRTWLADGVWPDIVKLLDEEGKGTPVLSYEAGPALTIRTSLDGQVLPSVQGAPDVVHSGKTS